MEYHDFVYYFKYCMVNAVKQVLALSIVCRPIAHGGNLKLGFASHAKCLDSSGDKSCYTITSTADSDDLKPSSIIP